MVKPGNWHFQEHHIPMILTSPNSTISFRTRLPDFPAQLIFYLSTDPATWNEEEGDGVIYRILLQPVEEESPQEEGNPGEGQTDLDQVEKVGKTEIFVQHIDPINNQADRRWYRQMEDLSPWVGQEVILTLVTEAGANDQNDSPGWGNPMIVPPGLDRLPGPGLRPGDQSLPLPGGTTSGFSGLSFPDHPGGQENPGDSLL